MPNTNATGRHMTIAEMNMAINRIMEVRDVLVENKETENWITLYTCLCNIAKVRLGEDEYSTQMPLFHVYLYAKNLNEWTEEKFGWINCVPDQIKAYYGLTTFCFDILNYPTWKTLQKSRISFPITRSKI